MPSRQSVGAYPGDKLPRNSPGNARPQSSQLIKLLWIDPYLKSGTGVRELISALKKVFKKKGGGAQTGNDSSDSPPSYPPPHPRTRGK